MLIITEQQNTELLYRKWKRDNVTYRGMTDTMEDNGAGARFGKGLYTTPNSNKKMAKGYGELYYVVNGKPKHPKVFQDTNQAEIFIQSFYKNYDYSKREFQKHSSIENEMLKLGYDGLIVKGREMVNYKPEDVKYYKTEHALYDHFKYYVLNA